MPRTVSFNKIAIEKKILFLFSDFGYGGVSISLITETSGLNRSSLYNTFNCKGKMYIDALNYSYSIFELQFKNSNIAQISISQIKDLLCSFIIENPNCASLIARANIDTKGQPVEINNWIKEHQSHIEDILKSTIKNSSGNLKTNTPKLLSLICKQLFANFLKLCAVNLVHATPVELKSICNSLFLKLE